MKKSILFITAIPGILLPITLTQTSIAKNEEKKWYDKINNSKIEVRDFFSVFTNSNNKNLVNYDNEFELKLLLNHNYLDTTEMTNSNFITEKNKNFIEFIRKKGANFKKSEISFETPIVWLYFENEEQREKLVNFLISEKDIQKFILYKNDLKDNFKKENNNSLNGHTIFSHKKKDFDITNKEELYRTLNFNKQIERDKNSNFYKKNSEIGILEYKDVFQSNLTDNFDENGIEFLDSHITEGDFHGLIVSSVAAGDEGFDSKSKIVISAYRTNSDWQKQIEKMVTEKKLKIINHSYGSSREDKFKLYDEDSYFVDYISRKYGVVNVFSSGNGNANNGQMEWINRYSLSFNSVVVGALDKKLNSNVYENRIANYSNYKIHSDYNSIAKPLVVAPGHIEMKILNNEGTSFSSPIIAGVISTLLREKEFLNNDNFRIPSVKSILSSASISTNDLEQIKKRSGYSNKYGAGIPDFELMLKAADNLETVTVKKENSDSIIKIGKSFFVEKGSKIKSSLSWLFNAGLLQNKEKRAEYNPQVNWWWFLGPLGGAIANVAELNRINSENEKWEKEHINELQLKKETAFSRQNNSKFSDYDLILEKMDNSGNWIQVSSSISSDSNDELIEYNVTESSNFRLVIKKYKSSLFENSIEDNLSFTYVVKK
ncbi:S8 family serine peptidase [Mycoplasma sp. 613B]